jgi:hypothetical protein
MERLQGGGQHLLMVQLGAAAAATVREARQDAVAAGALGTWRELGPGVACVAVPQLAQPVERRVHGVQVERLGLGPKLQRQRALRLRLMGLPAAGCVHHGKFPALNARPRPPMRGTG